MPLQIDKISNQINWGLDFCGVGLNRNVQIRCKVYIFTEPKIIGNKNKTEKKRGK